MKQDQIREYIEELGYESVLLFENPSYETAFVGVSEDERAVYNYELMVEFLVEHDDMSIEDAADFISYNTIRSLPYYDKAPIVFYPAIDFGSEEDDQEETTVLS